jgi:hypothetical protein
MANAIGQEKGRILAKLFGAAGIHRNASLTWWEWSEAEL